jgi:hypothetical protein
MSDDTESGDRGQADDRPQDPLVERRRPDPAQPPERTRTLQGLLGDSDRPGMRRLYFTAELDVYAEFRTEDVVSVADIPADRAPFLGEQATRVELRRDAAIDFTRTRQRRPVDEFDLDVRLAARAGADIGPGGGPATWGEQGCYDTYGFGCQETGTIVTFTCVTEYGETCGVTCGLTCGQTCVTCGQTCAVTCGPTCVTCVTCSPACGVTRRCTGVRCTIDVRCLPRTAVCEAATAVC